MIMVINNFHKFSFFICYNHKYFCSSTCLKVEKLVSRSLIKLSGEDLYPFLQGLITNDINQLHKFKTSLFTFFLNNKGRILYDSLLYKKHNQEILIECDSLIKNELIKHLKIYRIRKKVDIESLNDRIWVAFKSYYSNLDKFNIPHHNNIRETEFEKLLEEKVKIKDSTLFKDPRVHSLGVRILVPSTNNSIEIISDISTDIKETDEYKILRYKLGIAEGINELPPGNCFPLEANCDYLSGVSFKKGCYIGQELTTRSYHTGVIRKRLMPLIMSSVPENKLTLDSIIETRNGKKVGKLRGIYKNYAIALLRVADVLGNDSELIISGISASTYKPFWWPQGN